MNTKQSAIISAHNNVHPNLDKELYIQGYQQGANDMIEKACQWLSSTIKFTTQKSKEDWENKLRNALLN